MFLDARDLGASPSPRLARRVTGSSRGSELAHGSLGDLESQPFVATAGQALEEFVADLTTVASWLAEHS